MLLAACCLPLAACRLLLAACCLLLLLLATCACSPISGAHMRAARGLRDPGLCASPQGHDWVDDCAYAPPRCLAAWCTQVSCGAHLRCACVVPPPSLAGVAGDVLAVVGRVCSSPLAPSSLVRFSATCRYVRTVLRPVVEELQALHAAVRVLCTKIGMRPADLGKVTELNAAFKRLDYADVAVLVTLANSGSLRLLTVLSLADNNISDPGMVALSEALGNGSLRSLTQLFLNDIQCTARTAVIASTAANAPTASTAATGTPVSTASNSPCPTAIVGDLYPLS